MNLHQSTILHWYTGARRQAGPLQNRQMFPLREWPANDEPKGLSAHGNKQSQLPPACRSISKKMAEGRMRSSSFCLFEWQAARSSGSCLQRKSLRCSKTSDCNSDRLSPAQGIGSNSASVPRVPLKKRPLTTLVRSTTLTRASNSALGSSGITET